jgi:hypothetical protein
MVVSTHSWWGRLIALLALAICLVACDAGGAVQLPTQAAPDAGFRTYRHPTGAFTIRLPTDWTVRDVSTNTNARVEFSPPNNNGLPVTVYVLNTGSVLTAAGLLDSIDSYQRQINGDSNAYREVSRTAQGDGSWRLVGWRKTAIGDRQLNTFLQSQGSFLLAIEADVTDIAPAASQALRTVINSVRLDPNVNLGASTPQAPAAEANNTGGTITFSAVYAWTNLQGEYIINGLVTNQSGAPVEAIRITATLFDAAGNPLVQEGNVVATEVLLNEKSAPFSVRFRSGKPGDAYRYELGVAARAAEYALPTYLADDQFIRGNEAATYNANGFLTVSGDVVNNTQDPANFVKAVVAVFDEQGQVVATDTVFLNKQTLLPGEVSRFEATFPEIGGSAIRYVVSIEGRK